MQRFKAGRNEGDWWFGIITGGENAGIFLALRFLPLPEIDDNP